jgi:hypothetical protein
MKHITKISTIILVWISFSALNLYFSIPHDRCWNKALHKNDWTESVVGGIMGPIATPAVFSVYGLCTKRTGLPE